MRRFTFLVILLVLFCVPAYSQSANGKRVLMDDDERSGGSRNAIAAAHDPTPVSNLQFSAAGNFSSTSNPNGVWSYGFTTTLGGTFTPYTISGTTFLSGEVGWFGPIPGAPNAPGYPLVVATPVGTPELLDMGPGPGGEYTVVRWTAASKGVWDVVGRFQGLGRTSSDVHVLSNGTSLFDAALFGSDSAQFALTMRTQPGDTIDFAVGFGPDRSFDFDSTGLEAVIAPHVYDFTAINFPGANLTVANGLNDHGDIVGGYRDSKGITHAYLLSQGNFTTIDPPGAIRTAGIAINNPGVIGGHFLDSNNVRHSYLLDHGAFTIFDFPGATGTFLQGMNDRGQVVGAYLDSAGNTHGFLLSAGNFTTIDAPGAAVGALGGTVAGGINDPGQIVGNFGDALGIVHGFLLSAGNFTTVDFPGALDLTAPFGISANGEIVGFYNDSHGVVHGFKLIAGNFSTVDFPGAFNTSAIRVNQAGQIVGSYQLAGRHGFLATPIPKQKP